MEYKALNENGRAYTYVKFPEHFVWKGAWQPRQVGNCIGRLYFVAPWSGEKYYLRVLLHHVHGAKSWEEIRSVNGHACPTMKEACVLRGLLQDDTEFELRGAMVTQEEWTWRAKHQVQMRPTTLLPAKCREKETG